MQLGVFVFFFFFNIISYIIRLQYQGETAEEGKVQGLFLLVSKSRCWQEGEWHTLMAYSNENFMKVRTDHVLKEEII